MKNIFDSEFCKFCFFGGKLIQFSFFVSIFICLVCTFLWCNKDKLQIKNSARHKNSNSDSRVSWGLFCFITKKNGGST